MVKINGLYYDGYVEKIVDNILIKRFKHNYDNLIIINGGEGTGKSSFAIGLCALYAHKLGIDFSVDNITFSGKEMVGLAASKKKSIILYDEAIQGLMGAQWQNKTQQTIIQALMMARKNNNLFVLCVPAFERLNPYLVYDRAILLIDVYSKGYKRGFASIYNKKKIRQYYDMKKAKKDKKPKPVFQVRFLDHSKTVIDKPAYEKKKDEAIMLLNDSLDTQKEGAAEKHLYRLLLHEKYDSKLLATILGIHASNAREWKRKAKLWRERETVTAKTLST